MSLTANLILGIANILRGGVSGIRILLGVVAFLPFAFLFFSPGEHQELDLLLNLYLVILQILEDVKVFNEKNDAIL